MIDPRYMIDLMYMINRLLTLCCFQILLDTGLIIPYHQINLPFIGFNILFVLQPRLSIFPHILTNTNSSYYFRRHPLFQPKKEIICSEYFIHSAQPRM